MGDLENKIAASDDLRGDTFVHLAAKKGNVEVIKEALCACPSRNMGELVNRYGETPRQLAIHGGHFGVVELLDGTPMHRALANASKLGKMCSRFTEVAMNDKMGLGIIAYFVFAMQLM